MNYMTNTTIKSKVNLNTYYILPLLNLSMSSYGEDNFIKSQITKYGEVVVFIKNKDEAGEYWNHSNYGADVDEEDGTTMIVYNIPERFLEDYQMFLDSKYSKMSMFAKDLIKKLAKDNKLDWCTPTNTYVDVQREGKAVREKQVNSSEKLLALDLYEGLRAKYEIELGVKISPTAELWSRINIKEEVISLN